MIQIPDKDTRKNMGYLIIILIIIVQLILYFFFDINFIGDAIKRNRYISCCFVSIYYDREYYGVIDSIGAESAITEIKFENNDSTYILDRFVYDSGEEIELADFIDTGMYLYKPKSDSNLYFENLEGDTLKFKYHLERYKGDGPFILAKTYLNDLVEIQGGK